MRTRQKILDTSLNAPIQSCPAHGRLVEVLLSLDSRILRLEVLSLIVLALSAPDGIKGLLGLLKGML